MALKKLTDSNEQLDAILRCLNHWSYKVDDIKTETNNGITETSATLGCNHKDFRKISDLIIDLASLEKADIDSNTIKLALEYLISENMVKLEMCHTHKEITGYRILFKGRNLLVNGGFQGVLAQKNATLVLERRNEKYLRYGAVGAATGSFLLLLWEIYKFAKENPFWFHF